MSQSSPTGYVDKIHHAWIRKNGKVLSKLLSLRDEHVYNRDLKDEGHSEVTRIRTPLNEIISSHLKCIASLRNKDSKSAYENHNNLSQEIIKIFQTQKEENWMLPVVCTICLELRLIALSTHKSKQRYTPEAQTLGKLLEDVADVLMSAFRICAGDGRTPESKTKKWGMMPIVNQLFKVYLKINKLYLMKPLIKTLDGSPYLKKFSLSDVVTYRYCVGRKSVYDGNYKRANEDLTFAFERCHAACKKNKRQILIYLVPTKILLGIMPIKDVMVKYDLLPLWDIALAVKRGALKEFNDAIVSHGKFLNDAGIYMIIEKLRIIAYRNLFKKVYLLNKDHVLPMDALTLAMRISQSPDVEPEETHCILTNLIDIGRLKGYISHTHQKIVFSKLQPFPKLSTF